MQPFNTEHYMHIIQRLFETAVAFELLHDKFFELQEHTPDLTDEQLDAIQAHPDFAAMEGKLEKIEAVIAHLK